MRNGYILSGSKWHTQNISFWRLQIFCLCSLFCFEQNRDTFLFVFAGSKLCTILVILFRVLLVTKVNNLPRYCAAQSAKPNLEVLSRTRTKARFFLLFTVLFSTIPSISSSERESQDASQWCVSAICPTLPNQANFKVRPGTRHNLQSPNLGCL